jgi:hypothetical protein
MPDVEMQEVHVEQGVGPGLVLEHGAAVPQDVALARS